MTAPVWDLSELYAGREDPAIARDLDRAAATVAELAGLEGAFLAARRDPARLGALIAEAAALYESAVEALGGPAAYVALAAAVERRDPAWAKAEADVRARAAAISGDALFLTLELNALDEAEIAAALEAEPRAARLRPWLRRVRAQKPHELSAELERLLVDRAPAVAQWTRLFDETLARMTVRAGRERLTLNEALVRLASPERRLRRAAGLGLAEALAEAEPVLALALNTVAYEKRVEDRLRGFASPADARHLANEVDAAAVEAMVEAVAGRYASLSHRYYALKARAMGLPVLEWWDRNAPVETAAPRGFEWDEARALVLAAFADLGPEFRDRAAVFFEQPRIHARILPGKSSGAFAHPVTPGRRPFVFMNYAGERRDVLTLAHELGHAVHQTLAAPLGSLLGETPLTLAETASIFAEGLVFDRLLAEARPAERRGLLAGRIEDGLNTVVRQVAFHRFETRLHAARAEAELAPEEIGGLWTETMAESLGPAVRLGDGYAHLWAYVAHFVHAPFYVYAYAFGDLLVAALMETRRADPEGFAPKYRDLLAGGGTRTYAEALAPFGLDPRDPDFWSRGLDRLERLVDAFEAG